MSLPTFTSSQGASRIEAGPFPWWMRGGHLETILGSTLPSRTAPSEAIRDAERHVVPVAPGTAVETWWSRPKSSTCGSVLIVHGLGGSADRPHVRALAEEALRRGWHAVRVNLRNHGGTEALSSTLFAAVQSDDLEAVLAEMEARELPRPYLLVGVSLGGNMALRYGALADDASQADAVATVSPALDFFVIERHIQRLGNLVYRLNFVLGLCRMLNAIRALRPVEGPPADLRHIHSIRDFDHAFTAPAAGFPDVDAYYAAGSASPLLEGLRVPVLLLTARNDPFIPARLIERHHGAAGGRVEALVTARGGHVGYRVTGEGGGAAFWAAAAVFDWAERALQPSRAGGLGVAAGVRA